MQHNKPIMMQSFTTNLTSDSIKKNIYHQQLQQKPAVKIEEISENYLPRKKSLMDSIVADDGKHFPSNKQTFQ